MVYKILICLRFADLSFSLGFPSHCHPVSLLKTQAFRWINNPEQKWSGGSDYSPRASWKFQSRCGVRLRVLEDFPLLRNEKKSARECLFFKLRNKSSVLFVPHLEAVDGQGMRATPREEQRLFTFNAFLRVM